MMNRADLKIAIVGRNGQLAWEANQRFQGLGQIICVGRPEVDLADLEWCAGRDSQNKTDCIG